MPPTTFYHSSTFMPDLILSTSATVVLPFALYLFTTRVILSGRGFQHTEAQDPLLSVGDEDDELGTEPHFEDGLAAHTSSPSLIFPHLGTPLHDDGEGEESSEAELDPYTSPALQIANASQKLTFLIFIATLVESSVLVYWSIDNVLQHKNYPKVPLSRLMASVPISLAWCLQYWVLRFQRKRRQRYDRLSQGFWIIAVIFNILEMFDVGRQLLSPDEGDGPPPFVENTTVLALIMTRSALCLTLAATMFGLAIIQCHERPTPFFRENVPSYALPSAQTPEIQASNEEQPSTLSSYPLPAEAESAVGQRASWASDLSVRTFLSRKPWGRKILGLTTTHGAQNDVAPSSNSAAEGDRPRLPSSERSGKEAADRYKPPTSFQDFYEKLKKLLPFLWPRRSTYLQLMILGCMLMLILGRVINLLVPTQLGQVLKVLEQAAKAPSHAEIEPRSYLSYASTILAYGKKDEGLADGKASASLNAVWLQIIWYVLLRFLQGSNGAISTMQTFMWFPVGQFTTKEISIRMFEHLHNLSLRYHLNRKTGEILRVQDRGVASVISLLTAILFNIVPCLVDIAVACVYFTVTFDVTLGLIVFVTMSMYIVFTVIITEWRTKFRRDANLLDNAMQARAVDSLLNFETVKYYNAERFEVQMYDKAIDAYNAADWKSQFTLSVLNTIQNVVIQIGLLVGCMVCAKRIVDHTMTVSDFVLYLTYITQLYGPLNWFGSYYRVIQKNFVDMEKMLDLFREPLEVRDIAFPAKLKVDEGVVQFENVSFHYDPRLPTLNNISFTVPKGATVALVGPSGGGKSTILRLLFRFYDVQKGRVLVDGQDIRFVKQSDLRSVIGVVPQDTVLFNEDIMYNIRYGNVLANDEDCIKAAKAAHIHERIMAFPDGYATKVGERGLRLSGGEKQRVAIARTLLKDPKIILLDEATSALDTHTERHIQHALDEVTVGKTTMIIAHRLSTIVHADMILVLEGGEIVERGSHETLMQNASGVYYNMWLQQLRDDNKLRTMLLNENDSADIDEADTADLSRIGVVAEALQKAQRPDDVADGVTQPNPRSSVEPPKSPAPNPYVTG